MRPKFQNNLHRLGLISFQNIGRNLLLSVATTVMMGLILFIFNVVMVLNVLAQSSITSVNEKVDLIIYISEEAGANEIESMLKDIQSVPVVTEAVYTSPGDALKDFLAQYPEKADPFSSFGIANPLPGNIRIVTEKPEEHSLVIDYLRDSKHSQYLLDIESSNENQEIINRLVKVTNFTQKLIIGVIVTFVFGSLLIVINAIHLSIFTRKREIQIMQLVGARPNMIRTPFLVEGALYSLIAVFFSFTLLIFFLEGAHLMQFANFEASFRPGQLFLGELIISVGIGVLSSHIAMTYYLTRNLVLDS